MNNYKTLLFLLLSTLLWVTSCKRDAAIWKHRDNTVRIRTSAAIKTLNPFLGGSGWTRTATELIFQYPMDFDPKTMELAPQLAKSAPVVENLTEGPFAGGQKFTFELLEDAVWDDGKPVTGHDYEFALKVLFHPKLPLQAYASYLEFVKDVQVEGANPKKFSVFTNKKYLLAFGAVSNLTLVPAHLYDPHELLKDIQFRDLIDPSRAQSWASDERLQKFADAFLSPRFGKEVVSGSGPYRLAEWVDDQRIVLVKKSNWWGDRYQERNLLLTARPDTIIFLPIADQTAAIAALKSEDLDAGSEFEVNQFLDLKRDSFLANTYNFETPPRLAFFYLAMQNRNPKLSDKKVRQAIARLLDVDAIIRDFYGGMAERIVGPFLPDKKYYHHGLKPVAFNPDEARSLLASAGWQDTDQDGVLDKIIDGQKTPLKIEFLYTPGVSLQENLLALLRDQAAKAGIEINGVAVEANAMRQRLRSGEYEMAGLGAAALPLPDDPKQFFHTDSAQPGGSNYTRFGNAQTDAIIDEIRTTTNEARRTELYRKFQEILYEEQPMVFLFAPKDRVVIHKRFEALITRRSPGFVLPLLKQKG